MSTKSVEVAGRRLSLSNLEKDLYPSHGFTKAHILEYYRRISGALLPHLKGRALTMKRFPEGVDGGYFFEKRCPGHRPPWVATANIPQDDGEMMTVCLVNDLGTLLWVANLASLELHVPLARADSPGTPDSVVFDLDPGEGADIIHCARTALIVRNMLAGLGLVSVVKTSGKKGLHVYVPLNNDNATFEETKRFSKAAAEVLEKGYPDLVTSKMAKPFRVGKVFINWSQNDRSKTMVSVYSLRAREKPMVSCPLRWDEVEKAVDREDRAGIEIGPDEAVARMEREGDLFIEVRERRQALPHG